MNVPGETASTTATTIEAAVDALGPGPLTALGLSQYIAPLFSRVLERNAQEIYLANHSLGRPLDATAIDIAEAVVLWQTRMARAWVDWSAEMNAYRGRLALLLGAPSADSIVPKTSAGQGLRAILNTYDTTPSVVATRGEFDSIDVILRQYAQRKRIRLRFVEPREGGLFAAQDLCDAMREGVELVVLSQVVFNTGQVLPELPAVIAAAHAGGARLFLDVYHSLGVIPVDIAALDADFAVGGSYKYLRGGPGACFLYIHPRHLDGSLTTLDTGWFAKQDPFTYQRPDPPRWAAGGDAFLESTPPILTWYQARAGQILTLALGAERLRAYSLALQRRLIDLLSERGVRAEGASAAYGAFCVVKLAARAEGDAARCAATLATRGVVCDARGSWLRLCPDILTLDDELQRAAAILAEVIAP